FPAAQDEGGQSDESAAGGHSFRELAGAGEQRGPGDSGEYARRDQADETNLERLNAHQARLIGIVPDGKEPQTAPRITAIEEESDGEHEGENPEQRQRKQSEVVSVRVGVLDVQVVRRSSSEGVNRHSADDVIEVVFLSQE